MHSIVEKARAALQWFVAATVGMKALAVGVVVGTGIVLVFLAPVVILVSVVTAIVSGIVYLLRRDSGNGEGAGQLAVASTITLVVFIFISMSIYGGDVDEVADTQEPDNEVAAQDDSEQDAEEARAEEEAEAEREAEEEAEQQRVEEEEARAEEEREAREREEEAEREAEEQAEREAEEEAQRQAEEEAEAERQVEEEAEAERQAEEEARTETGDYASEQEYLLTVGDSFEKVGDILEEAGNVDDLYHADFYSGSEAAGIIDIGYDSVISHSNFHMRNDPPAEFEDFHTGVLSIFHSAEFVLGELEIAYREDDPVAYANAEQELMELNEKSAQVEAQFEAEDVM